MRTLEEIQKILKEHGYGPWHSCNVWLRVPFSPSAIVTETVYIDLSQRTFRLKSQHLWDDKEYTKRQINAIKRANNRELRRYSHLDPELNEVLRHCS
jgi:hypothetical protein